MHTTYIINVLIDKILININVLSTYNNYNEENEDI